MRVEAFLMPDDWASIRRSATGAEAAGFDAVASPEIANDPFVTLTVAAGATERVGLRSAICVAFPRSPMVTANVAWDLNEGSGGRFGLGLGTQVKGHNERRFSVPWSAPAARLSEYVESLRAIWHCWQHGGPLQYEGEHYQFTLMTPEFRHAPTEHGPIPVYTAAVRPAMMRLAGRVSDGVRLHGFCTRRYLETVALPNLEKGLAARGRKRENFEICGGGFICTGPDEESVAKQLEWVRYRIAFYGSTRTYGPVFAAHGWQDLGAKLHHMSKTGQWKKMAAEISDDVVREFAAVGTYDVLAPEIERRFGGISDAVELGFAPDADPAAIGEAVAGIQDIACTFRGERTRWNP